MTTRYVPPDGVAYAAVIIDRPAPPGGLVVTLESLDTGVVTVPPSITLEEGWIGGQFPVTYVAVGATQIRASLDAVEVFLDVSCSGTMPSVRPALASMSLVEIRPAAVVGEDVSPRPATESARGLRPDGGALPVPEDVPKPKVAKRLRPKPTFAGE